MSTPPNNNQKTARQLFWEELDNLDFRSNNQDWVIPFVITQLQMQRDLQNGINTMNAMNPLPPHNPF